MTMQKSAYVQSALFCFFAATLYCCTRNIIDAVNFFFPQLMVQLREKRSLQTFYSSERLGLNKCPAFLTLNKGLLTKVESNILILPRKILLHKNYQQQHQYR